MNAKRWILVAVAVAACGPTGKGPTSMPAKSSVAKLDPKESHLANLRQLTFGGQNAEAYWSSDGTQLIFQSTRDAYQCDQIFRMPVDNGTPDVSLVSTGKG